MYFITLFLFACCYLRHGGLEGMFHWAFVGLSVCYQDDLKVDEFQ